VVGRIVHPAEMGGKKGGEIRKLNESMERGFEESLTAVAVVGEVGHATSEEEGGGKWVEVDCVGGESLGKNIKKKGNQTEIFGLVTWEAPPHEKKK